MDSKQKLLDRKWAQALALIAIIATIIGAIAGVIAIIPHPAQSNNTMSISNRSTPTETIALTPTLVPTQVPVQTHPPGPPPTQAPTPVPTFTSTLPYIANWSNGLNGWVVTSDWSLNGGNLVNDGTNSSSNWPQAVAPVNIPAQNYSVTTHIQALNGKNCFDVGGVRDFKDADGWHGYVAVVCDGEMFLTKRNGVLHTDLKSRPYDPGTIMHVYQLKVVNNILTLYIDNDPNYFLQYPDNNSPYLSGSNSGLNSFLTQVIISYFEVDVVSS